MSNGHGPYPPQGGGGGYPPQGGGFPPYAGGQGGYPPHAGPGGFPPQGGPGGYPPHGGAYPPRGNNKTVLIVVLVLLVAVTGLVLTLWATGVFGGRSEYSASNDFVPTNPPASTYDSAGTGNSSYTGAGSGSYGNSASPSSNSMGNGSYASAGSGTATILGRWCDGRGGWMEFSNAGRVTTSVNSGSSAYTLSNLTQHYDPPAWTGHLTIQGSRRLQWGYSVSSTQMILNDGRTQQTLNRC